MVSQFVIPRDLVGHIPAEVKKPSPTSLAERATFVRPFSVVLPPPAFQHPRNRVKEQAEEVPLALFLPTLKTFVIDWFNIKISNRPI